MTALDKDVLAQKVATVERHLTRVQQKLPATSGDLRPSTDTADAVILHLWQAVQVVIDLAVALCVRSNLGTPQSYAAAFNLLADAGKLDPLLAKRLGRAAGFRNVVAHAYESIDMQLVFDAASHGPDDLRAFLRRARDLADG